MNWEMTGAIAQLAAAIGVIPSVIYLAVQIREICAGSLLGQRQVLHE